VDGRKERDHKALFELEEEDRLKVVAMTEEEIEQSKREIDEINRRL